MNVTEFWSLVDQRGDQECWPWTGGTNGNDRGRRVFNGRSQYAYRIAWSLANDREFPDGLEARHACDNPICVNPNHIIPGTHAENMRDAADRNRARTTPRYGLEHHAATTSPESIKAIVDEWLSGSERQEDVAARHGISQATLSGLARGSVRPDYGIAAAFDYAKLKPCGTHAAYARHLRRGEKSCDMCLAAEREHCAKHRAKRRAQRSTGSP